MTDPSHAFVPQFLKQHRMALVVHPMPELPQPPEEITADFMYLRLHGDRVVEHDYDYTDEELAVYAKKVRRCQRQITQESM